MNEQYGIVCGMEGKNVVLKQKVSSKYHHLVEKCNSLHVSISCTIQLI